MKLHRVSWATLLVGILLGNGFALQFPKKMRIGNCGGCQADCPEQLDDDDDFTTMTPEITTTSSSETSVNEQAKAAVEDASTELSGLAEDAQSSKRKRSTTSTTEISITIIIEFKYKVERWITDLNRLSSSDITDIKSTTSQVKTLRLQVKSGTKTISKKSLAIIQSTVTITSRFIGGLSKAIAAENKQEAFASYQTTLTQVQSTVQYIEKTLTSLNTKFDQSASSDIYQEAIKITIRILWIKITIIIEMCSASVPPSSDTLTALKTYSAELQSQFSKVTVMSSQYQSQVQEVITLSQKASSTVSSAITINEKSQASLTTTLRLQDLLSATATVKESITSIVAAQKKTESFTNTIEISISSDVFTAYESLLTSLDSVSEESITVIKSFESTTSTIIQSLSTSKVKIVGFEKLVSLNKQMEQSVSRTIAEASSRSSIMEKTSTLSSVTYYVSYIIQIITEIQNASASSTSTQDVSSIATINSFLSSLDMSKLSQDDVSQLQTYSSDMETILESIQSSSFKVNGIADLLATAETTSQKTETLLAAAKASEERIVTIQRTEVTLTVINSIQTQISILMSKMSVGNSQSNMENIANIEDVISVLSSYMSKFASKSYVISEADVVDVQLELTQFISLVSQVSTFTKIEGLTEFVSIVKSANTVMQSKEQSLVKAFENKNKLETLSYASSFLVDLNVFITSLEESSSASSSSSSQLITEIQKQLLSWTQGVQYLQRSSVDDLQGFFISLENLVSSSKKVSGKDVLLSTISTLQTSIEEEVNQTVAADLKSELRFSEETTLRLVSDSFASFQELLELTKSARGNGESYSEVTNISTIITKLDKGSIEISTSFTEEFRMAFDLLIQFISTLKSGAKVTKVTGLEAIIAKTKSVKKSFQIRLQPVESSKVDVFTAVQQFVYNVKVSLETIVINETAVDTTEMDEVESEAIDDFFEYLMVIQEQTNSINDDFLQSLQILAADIQNVIMSANDYTIISGYQFSVTEIIVLAESTVAVLSEVIESEKAIAEASEEFSSSKNLLSDIKEIVYILTNLLTLETVSNENYQEQFQGFTVTLQAISSSVSTFSDFSAIKAILRVLKDIEDTNSKPNGLDLLFTEAQSTLQQVETYATDIATEYRTSASIRQVTAISQVTTSMAVELDSLMEVINLEQLVGENNAEVDELIVYLNTLSENVDFINEEVLTYISEQFSMVVDLVNELPVGKGIGNFIAFKSAVNRVMVSAENRKKEQEDREIVKETVIQVESSMDIVKQIQEELSAKLKVITSEKMKDIDSSADQEVANLTSVMRRIVQGSISEVNIEELNSSLSTIKSLQVTAGKEISGIFELHSLTEQSISAVTSEKQFLISTQQSRRNIDILTSSSKVLLEIQSFLEGALTLSRNVEYRKETSSTTVFEDLFTLLMKIVKKEELSFSFIDDLEFLFEDLSSSSQQIVISAQTITEALELTKTASFVTKTTLHEEKRTSSERQSVVFLERTTSIITRTQEKLQSFVTISGGQSSEKVENENITKLLSVLTEIAEMKVMEEDKITTLEELMETIETIDESEFSGKTVAGLKDAVNIVTTVEKTVKSEMMSSSKSIERSVMKAQKTQAINVMQRITNTVTSLISSMQIVSTEEINPTVSNIIEMMNNISLESMTMEQISLLQEKAQELETVKLESDTGISGLRELKSITVARGKEIQSSDKVLSAVNKISDSKKLFTRRESTLTLLREELSSITQFNGSTGAIENNDMISALFQMISVGVSELSGEDIILLEDAVENFKVLKSTIKVELETVQTLISKITSSEKEIKTKLDSLQTQSAKLQQTQAFTEVNTLLKSVSEVTEEILFSSAPTDSGVENEIINEFVVLLKRFRSSVTDMNDEHLQFIRDGITELNRILNKGESINGISQLSELSTSVLSSVSRESVMLERETQRQEKLVLQTKQEYALSYTTSILERISRNVGEFGTDIEYTDEVEVLEIERILYILTLIKQGIATENDVMQLQSYTETLESSMATYSFGVKVTGLSEALETTNAMRGDLQKSVIENSFDVNYSESVYEQKQIKSVLYETSSFLESLVVFQGNDTSESFSSSLFDEILQNIDKLGSRSFKYSSTVLKRNLDMLRVETANLTQNTFITGLDTVVRKTKSAVATADSSITRSYTIEYLSNEVTNLNEANFLFSKLEFILGKIATKSENAPSSSSKTLVEMNEIVSFLQDTEIYSSRELVILNEYIELFLKLEQDITNEKVDGLSSLKMHVGKQKMFVSKMFSEQSRAHKSEKQVLYTGAANDAVQNTYSEVTSISKKYVLSEVKEVKAITKFSLFLRSQDISAINAVGISKMKMEMELFSTALAENIDLESIAYLSGITEQLVQFTAAAERHLNVKQTYDRNQRVSSVLKESREAMQSTTSHLKFLRDSVSANSITVYEENTVITELYNFLKSYAFDFRQITDDFAQQLKSFNFSSITVRAGTGITYLEEVFNLIEVFDKTREQATENVRSTEVVLAARDLQSSVSIFTKATEQFLYKVDDSTDLEHTPYYNLSTPIEGNVSQTTLPINETTGSPNDRDVTTPTTSDLPYTESPEGESTTISTGIISTTSPGSHPVTSGHSMSTYSTYSYSDYSSTYYSANSFETTEGTEYEREIDDPEEIFMKIQNNMQKMSSGSVDFKGQLSLETTELINRFMESDVSIIFSTIGISQLQYSLSVFHQVSETISSSVQDMESSMQVKESFTLMDETVSILKSIESSYTNILTSKKGSSTTISIISSIEELLKSFTNVHFISSEDVALLRTYSYELSTASISTSDLILNVTDFSSLISSTMASVQTASTSQSALMTVSALSTSEMKSGMSQSGFVSLFESVTKTSRTDIIYSKEETATIKEISQVSQQFYVLKEYNKLLELAMESLQGFYNSSQSSAGGSTEASGESGSTTTDSSGSDDSVEVEETDENESTTLFTQIAQTLRIASSSIHSLQIDSLKVFASYIKKIKTVINSAEVIDLTILDDTISYVSKVKQSFNGSIEKYSAYAAESQVFLNLEESSSSIQKFTSLFSVLESSGNGVEDVVIEESTLEHINSITKFIIQYSLRSSTITEESLNMFKESFYHIEKFASTNRFYTSDFEIWRSFLVDSRVTVSESVQNLARIGSVARSQTQREFFVNKGAITIVDQYNEILSNFTVEGDDTEESDSPARGRLIQIFTEFLQVLNQWTFGTIESYQITKFETYLSELKELSGIGCKLPVPGSPQSPLDPGNILESLQLAERIISASLERNYIEMGEDEDDAEIDAKYEYFSQMNYFLQNSRNMKDEVMENEATRNDTASGYNGTSQAYTATEKSTTMEASSTGSNLNSISNGTGAANSSAEQIDSELQELSYLLQIFGDSFSNPLLISIEDIDSNFTALIFKLQKVQFFSTNQMFMDLLLYIEDANSYVKASRDILIYERAVLTAKLLSKSIPGDLEKTSYNAEYLIYNQEVSRLHGELQDVSSQLYSVSRNSLRKLSKNANRLQYIIETHGSKIVNLLSIDENLGYVQVAARKYVKFAMKQYSYQRAASILEKAAADIDMAEVSIKALINSFDSTSVMEYTEEKAVSEAFYFFVNLTSDYTFLPRNLGRVIHNFNFDNLNITEGYSITHLDAVYHMVKRLKDSHARVQSRNSYMKAASNLLIIRQTLNNIVKKLKEFSVVLEEGEDIGNTTESGMQNFTESTTSFMESTSSPLTNSFTNESYSGDNETEVEQITIDDVIANILNITDNLFINGLQIEESQIEELERYSSFILELPFEEGRKIRNLLDSIERLSYDVSSLSLAVHSYESALYSSEAYNVVKEVREINKVVKSSLNMISDAQGTMKMKTLLDALQDYYNYFAKGFSYILQDDIDSCWELAYELSSLNNSQANVAVNVSSMLSLISEVELKASDVEGILSGYVYHYERVISHGSDGHEMIKAFELSSSSQLSYLLYELDGLFMGLNHMLSKQVSSEMDNSTNATYPDEYYEITSSLKAIQVDLNIIQFNMVNEMSELILDIENMLENSTVNDKAISELADFINIRKDFFRIIGEPLEEVGRVSTQVLILQDAAGIVEYLQEETHRWIYGDSGDVNNSNVTGNESASGISTLPSNVTGNSAQTTTFAPTTIGKTSSTVQLTTSSSRQTSPLQTTTMSSLMSSLVSSTISSNASNTENTTSNSSALHETVSFQDIFENMSDILMFWTFDSSKVNGKSVVELKYFMKELEDSCQLVTGLHMWEQVLLDANITLLSVIQTVYQEYTLQRARTEEALTRYLQASEVLESLVAIIGLEEDIPGNETSPSSGNDTTNLFSSTDSSGMSYQSTNGGDNSSIHTVPSNDNITAAFSEGTEYYSDGASIGEDFLGIEETASYIRERMDFLVTLSYRVLGKWSKPVAIKQFETDELESYSSEMSELFVAGGVLEDNTVDLRAILSDAQNQTQNALDLLDLYSGQSHLMRGHVLTISFFQQLEQLVEYSVTILKLAENLAENGTTTSNSTITSATGNTDSSTAASTVVGSTGTAAATVTGSSSTSAGGTGTNATTANDNSTVSNHTDSLINGTNEDTGNGCIDLLCAAKELLMSLEQIDFSGNYSNGNESGGVNSTESSLSSSTGISSNANATTALNNSTPESGNSSSNITEDNSAGSELTGERPNFMELLTFEDFDYHDLRNKVYQFSRAMRKFREETSLNYGEVISTLEQAKPIISKQLDELNKKDILPTANVTMYINTSNFTDFI